ncbi:MAG: DMT family transporter [Candidatus Woesearchaeota archaeon]
MKKNSLVGAMCIIIAASLWGLDGVVLRPRLYHLSVPVVVFLEHFIAFFFMLGFLIYDFSELKTLGLRDWGSFFWIALFGGAIGTMAITKALFHVNFEHLSVIIILQKLQPMFAILLALIVLGERPSRLFYLWSAFAILGSYLITFGFNAPVFEGNKIAIASLFSLLAAFSFGSSTVFGKRALKNASFRVATYIRFGLTSLIMFAIIFWMNEFTGFGQITKGDIVTLLIIAFSTGGVAIFIYYFGLKQVPASSSAIYELAFPVSAIILDYIVHGSVMSPIQWLGAVIIMVSMLKISRMTIPKTEVVG